MKFSFVNTTKIKYLFIIFYCYSSLVSAQNGSCTNSFFITGRLLQCEGYYLKFCKPFAGQVTLKNGIVQQLDSNYFFFISTTAQDSLKIYSTNVEGNAHLIDSEILTFSSPEYEIMFNFTTQGGSVDVRKSDDWITAIKVLSSNIDFAHLPFDTIKLMFYSNGKLVERSFTGKDRYIKAPYSDSEKELFKCPGCFPAELVSEIKNSHSELLIIKTRVKYDDRTKDLPPAVFFLKYD